jgi:hypothetical protein
VLRFAVNFRHWESAPLPPAFRAWLRSWTGGAAYSGLYLCQIGTSMGR